MKNLILNSFVKKKMFMGILTILFVVLVSSVSFSYTITGHVYRTYPNSLPVPLTDYTVQIFTYECNPNNDSYNVNILAGEGSSNDITYNSNGTYDANVSNIQGGSCNPLYTEVFIIITPNDDNADWVPTYYPCAQQFEYAEYFTISNETNSLEPIVKDIYVVGTENMERPTGFPLSLHGNFTFPNNSGNENNFISTSISVFDGEQIISASHTKNNFYSININPAGIYKILFSRPGCASQSFYFDGSELQKNSLTNNINFKNLSHEKLTSSFLTKKYDMNQNYPNPFNPSTTINFDIPKAGLVSLKVYDISGKEVAQLLNEFKNEGNYSVNFNASKLSSGIYFYSLSSNGNIITKRMTLIK